MKNFHTKNWFIFLIIVAVIVLLIFFNGKGLLSGIKNIFFKAASPFLNFFQHVAGAISNFCQSFLETKDLKRENATLKEENSRLLSEIAKINELERENKILREKFQSSGSEIQILAQVRGFDGPRTSILINQGQNQGILNSLSVISASNMIVGRTSEAYFNFSKILLINSPLSEVAAMTQDERAKGILRGKGAGNSLSLEMVSKEEEIKVGDKIIASGLDNIFSKGFLIGEVVEIVKNDLEIFQKAKIKPYVDFDDLEEVFILIEADKR